MTTIRISPGGWGWIFLAVYVAFVDAWLIRHNKATLSEVFGYALEHPVRRLPVVSVWVFLTLHLFACFLPVRWRNRLGKYDPLHRAARWIERKAI